MTYNSRRGILGAIPLYEKIAYHLFHIDVNASKSESIVKLSRKSKWSSRHTRDCDDNGGIITGIDFNPTGEYVATIDESGICLISSVDTNSYICHEGNMFLTNTSDSNFDKALSFSFSKNK